MTSSGPRLLRYALSTVFLLLAVFGELGALITMYTFLGAVYPPLPSVSLRGWMAFAATPRFALMFVGLAGLSLAAGVRRYGSLSSFGVAVIRFVDGTLRLSLFDEPLVEGRVRQGDVSWRLRYWDDDRIETLYQECPRCGIELDERYVPRHELHEPNVVFEAGSDVETTESEGWADVYGRETSDDRDETLGLVCPQCRSSIPSTKDAAEGRTAAKSRFRNHVAQMKLDNPKSDPFESYADRIRAEGPREPTPTRIWDQYVSRTDDDDVLPIGPSPDRRAADPGAPADEAEV